MIHWTGRLGGHHSYSRSSFGRFSGENATWDMPARRVWIPVDVNHYGTVVTALVYGASLWGQVCESSTPLFMAYVRNLMRDKSCSWGAFLLEVLGSEVSLGGSPGLGLDTVTSHDMVYLELGIVGDPAWQLYTCRSVGSVVGNRTRNLNGDSSSPDLRIALGILGEGLPDGEQATAVLVRRSRVCVDPQVEGIQGFRLAVVDNRVAHCRVNWLSAASFICL